MKQFVCKPTIHMFPTCKDFLAGFDIGEDDLVLSNASTMVSLGSPWP